MRRILFALMLSGCTTLGPIQEEKATVVDLPYLPASHGTGFTTGGNVAFVSSEEQYALVFECEHGRFVYNGGDASMLWHRFKKDQKVTIDYQTRYDSSGSPVGLHFVGAR